MNRPREMCNFNISVPVPHLRASKSSREMQFLRPRRGICPKREILRWGIGDLVSFVLFPSRALRSRVLKHSDFLCAIAEFLVWLPSLKLRPERYLILVREQL